MTEARIGRLVVAALHESLVARLPFRVEFYEHWLQPPRMRSGSIGMASFLAVLSFLRQEGPVYDSVVEDAGHHAAAWVFAEVATLTRLRWRWLPRGRRFRAALRLTQQLAAESTPGTRCRFKWRRSTGHLQLDESPFCSVRAHVEAPLCGFYSAALGHFCASLGVPAEVTHQACRAMGAPACIIGLAPADATLPAAAAPAHTTERS